MNVLIGTYTKRKSKGIYKLELDEHHKDLKNLSTLLTVENPTYLVSTGGSIFTIAQKENKGGIAYYENLHFMSEDLNDEKAPCYISYDETHDLIFSANYHTGNIKVYKLHYKYVNHIQTINYLPNSHAHYVQYIPSLDKVFVCDLGLDQVHAYQINDSDQLEHRFTLNLPFESGPRHLVSHPTKPLLYIFTELSCEVFVCSYSASALEIIQTVKTTPNNETKKHGAAIRISADGKNLYTSNRGDNSLSVFSIDQFGIIEQIQQLSTMGEHPRDFNISHDQETLIVANMESDSLSVFNRDLYTGKLKYLHSNIEVYEPVCVVFKD